MPPSLRLTLGLIALLPTCAVRAADLSVDVVIDFNSGGYTTVRPSADKPAYYLPLPLGYAAVGDPVPFQKPPPPAGEVEHLLAKALFDQGYRLATRQSPPSLALVISWGYMAPRLNRDSEELAAPPGAAAAGPAGSSPLMLEETLERSELALPQYAQGHSQQMLSLVAGDTLKDRNIDVLNNRDPRVERFLDMARSPRYFLLLSAYDYKDWMQHYEAWREHRTSPDKRLRPMALWEARVSTELEGHSLEEVLPTMITTAAPLFGRETKTPQLITAPEVPAGHSEVGSPRVISN